jgi:hypothetical protein
MPWRGLISLAIVAAAIWAPMIVPAQANDSGNPRRRADYAAKLQDMLSIGGKTQVSVEGSDNTVLRVINPGALRRQFKSLIHPYWDDLHQQGFESVLLCKIQRKVTQWCDEYLFAPGFEGP